MLVQLTSEMDNGVTIRHLKGSLCNLHFSIAVDVKVAYQGDQALLSWLDSLLKHIFALLILESQSRNHRVRTIERANSRLQVYLLDVTDD